MRPLFADPRTDFAFYRIFGTEEHKDVLLGFLNHVLELDEAHRIVEVHLLTAEQRPKVKEIKNSIVDVKCKDARGTIYVVEMQVAHVEAFEKRVVYNVAKAFVNQLGVGQDYPALNDVVGVTICEFELWPEDKVKGVPMLSHWRMQEQHGGATGLGQVQLVFLELPKYKAGNAPISMVDKWAYFFREAKNLAVLPEVLSEQPFRNALQAALSAGFTVEEWDEYIRNGMVIEGNRGAIPYAEKRGEERGLKQGLEQGKLSQARAALRQVLAARQLDVSTDQETRMGECIDVETLERWLRQAIMAATTAEALA